MKHILPLNDKILIQKAEGKERERSGIILTEQKDGQTNRGIIVAVGQGRMDKDGKLVSIDARLVKGTEVVFSWGDKVEIDGEEYFLVGSDSVLAIITQ
ncbi:MAG: co-chaperone GroES [Alphaproteobacteria bacterium]|nr:co-chaperone GroES [Alphaproteobacteria bacterium]